MSGFWSSETLQARLPELISPFKVERIVNCSYELGVGSQIYLTSDPDKTRRVLSDGEQIAILPGQFAKVLTQESVRIPDDALALISMKSEPKLRGLVNVSGFHVDPGYEGHLVFAVYNAGPSVILLQQGAPAFLIWYTSLDHATADIYNGKNQGKSELTTNDVMQIQGEVATPQALALRVAALEQKLERTTDRNKWLVRAVAVALLGAAITLGVRWLGQNLDDDKSPPSTTTPSTAVSTPGSVPP